MDFSASEISNYYENRVPGLSQPDRHEWRGPCPIHNGRDDNFSVDPRTGLAYCHSVCSRGWDVLSLEMELRALDFPKSKAEVFKLIGRPPEDWQDRDIESTFDYTDESGKVLYQVVRKTGKKFMQRRPVEGPAKWAWGLGDATPVPFQLPKLIACKAVVGICEGEKDALRLTRAGWFATCNNGGAGNFKPELAQWFAGKDVAVFADNDEAGHKHAEAVAKILYGTAASVRIVEMPDLQLKGDVSDFLNTKTVDDLHALYIQAQDWTPEWKFATVIPHENDKYLRTFGQFVKESGGAERFWASAAIEGLATPFDELTKNLGGMRPGEVYVIAANQGAGKTSLALQFALAALGATSGVLMFSMEMAHREVFQRIAGIDACADLYAYKRMLKYGGEPEQLIEMERNLMESTAMLSKAPLYVTTKSSVTPEFLTAEALRVKEMAKIDLVIVDHMQLMASTGKERSDYEKFTAISRTTKGIASELGVPLLLVSQTSRTNASDKRTELEVSDCRGSGAIEEDAAAVMLLYYDREDYALAKAEATGHRMACGPIKAWLKIGKSRYGPSGSYLPLDHWKSQTRFELHQKG